MTWTPALRLRTLALVLACASGIWMLTVGRNHAEEPSEQALRGDYDRDRGQVRPAPPSVELVAAIDDHQAARIPVSVERNVADASEDLNPDEFPEPTGEPVEDRVHPVYTLWDDSGGPPMLDDELTLTLVERADGAAFKPWSEVVSLSAVRFIQPKYSVAMPLPAPDLCRATCRDGRYKSTDVCVPM
jgi:hypothetical protein